MKTRLATKHDLPRVIEMLKHFRDQTPIDIMRSVNDADHITHLFTVLINGGGLVVLAEERDAAIAAERPKVVGMCIGMIDGTIWDPKLYVMRELVYWVEPEYRGGTAGYKLLKRYSDEAVTLLDQNRIKMYTISKLANSPDLDYGRFGFKKLEETWVNGI
jgi:N-acetylglutamate synthase-like GNAT family acetyltransferase